MLYEVITGVFFASDFYLYVLKKSHTFLLHDLKIILSLIYKSASIFNIIGSSWALVELVCLGFGISNIVA